MLVNGAPGLYSFYFMRLNAIIEVIVLRQLIMTLLIASMMIAHPKKVKGWKGLCCYAIVVWCHRVEVRYPCTESISRNIKVYAHFLWFPEVLSVVEIIPLWRITLMITVFAHLHKTITICNKKDIRQVIIFFGDECPPPISNQYREYLCRTNMYSSFR